MNLNRYVLSAALFGMPLSPVIADQSGDAVYNQTCIVCHGNGLLGAPRLNDGNAWKKRIAEGLDQIVPAALGGERQMPPKGNNPNLSDLEVARAVIWMSNQHGAKFPEPSADQLKQWRAAANGKKRNKP